jgi:hypothetical protein
VGGLGDGGRKPELATPINHRLDELIPVGEGLGMVSEPRLTVSLFCGHVSEMSLGRL